MFQLTYSVTMKNTKSTVEMMMINTTESSLTIVFPNKHFWWNHGKKNLTADGKMDALWSICKIFSVSVRSKQTFRI